MGPVVLFLMRCVMGLPAVALVVLLDSVSKEPYGPLLYLGTAGAGLALAQAFWSLVAPTGRCGLSASTLGTAAACGFVGTAVVAVGVVLWLFASGH
jgi:hypothetical protein